MKGVGPSKGNVEIGSHDLQAAQTRIYGRAVQSSLRTYPHTYPHRSGSLGRPSERPEDSLPEDLLVTGVLPDRRFMSKRQIEYSAMPVESGPGERPTIGSLMHTRLLKVHRAWVEAQEHVRSTIVEVADLVDLVVELQRIAEKCNDWIAGIKHLDAHILMPRVTVKIAAD